jgi:hypothetical protein
MALFTITVNAQVNLSPSRIGNLNLSLDYNELYTFTISDFTTNTTPTYEDPEGDIVNKVKIITLPIVGELTLSGVPINALDEISKTSIDSGLFKYQCDILDEDGYIDNNSTFDISDIGSGNFSELTPGIITFIVGTKPNLPPNVVGDGEMTLDYGITGVFTRDMFTTDSVPVYSDPEGDVAYQLKILSLPIAGSLRLNGTIVVINQNILFTDIDSGLFTYVPSLADIDGDSQQFTYSISDIGSQQFTE